MTKELQNNERYLSPSIVSQCLNKSKTTHVDKVICGNGFSTAFLNLRPSPGTVNILIAPNRAVIIGKERQHIIKSQLEDTIPTKFFYKGSQDYNTEDAEILCFVSDSFLEYRSQINRIKDKINFILIDEYHSTIIQSVFRNKLVDLVKNIRGIVGEYPGITTVTATPLYHSDIDIRIKTNDRFIKPIDINLTNDEVNAVKQIKTLLKANKNIIVATNSKTVVYNLRNENNTLEADFVIGDTLMSSVVELVQVKQNDRSNLKIISSKGFEGFDVYGDDYHVFFFEDRSKEFSTFYLSNLYQAINRCRDSVKYIEYIRLDLNKKRKEPFKNIDKAVNRFVRRSDISVHQKQRVEFDHYKPFIIFNQSEDGNFVIKKNKEGIALFKETLLYDNRNISDNFFNFLKERKINLIDKRNISNRLPRVQTPTKLKKETLYNNRFLIKDIGLFNEDYNFIVVTSDKKEDVLKRIKTYLRRKNYDGNYQMQGNEYPIIDYLTNESLFNRVVRELVKQYNKSSIEKYGLSKSKPWRDAFKEKSIRILLDYLQIFINKKLFVKRKEIGNRDYNTLTEISINEIKFISSLLNIDVVEIDIRNCFPRILYALNGLDLPKDFYGQNKENKLKINILLNNFMLDTSKASSYKLQKSKAIKNLKDVGIHDKVIEYLITNFFNSRYRGDLFNFLAFHEKKIIQRLRNKLLERGYSGVIRRHDSVILFDQKIDINTLEDFEYLKQYGWFCDYNPNNSENKNIYQNEFEIYEF
jgi:hypothetical protein